MGNVPDGAHMHSGLQVVTRTAALRMNKQSVAVGIGPPETGCAQFAVTTVVDVVELVVVAPIVVVVAPIVVVTPIVVVVAPIVVVVAPIVVVVGTVVVTPTQPMSFMSTKSAKFAGALVAPS
jgi:hypothetical protein